MTTATKYRQDLPPPGGYNSINYKRIPARSFFNGPTLILGYLGMTAVAAYIYKLTDDVIQRREIEMRSANLALHALLMAERDREYLKQLRRNRDEEKKLMAGVEDWEVGTYYGEPIYKTRPEDELVEPWGGDYYVHNSHKNFRQRAYLHLLS